MTLNQNPEQKARDYIGKLLLQSGLLISVQFFSVSALVLLVI